MSTDHQKISLTPNAYEHALRLKAENSEYENKCLRLYIEGKGCDGFFYGVCFDAKKQDDLVFSSDKIDLLVDPETYPYVKGSRIDWAQIPDLGEGFLVQNPRQRAFRGKFYKREGWQERL